jgi:hypothetical protein
MRTLIETKTGRVVNAGDVITLDGTAHILTDFDVPGLVGRGILTFLCDKPSNGKDNTKIPTEMCKNNIPDVGTDNDIDDCYHRDFIPIFDPQSLNLKKVLLTWGIKMGLKTEEEVLQYASLIKAATPVGFLGVVLRELADEFNMYDTYQSHEWAFDYANCQIVKVDPHQMLYPDNVVMFDSYQVLEHAIEICKELIDEICPDGK